MTTLYVQAPTLYLAGSGVVIGATSATLTSLTDIYGNVLTMADFGSLGYITLEPDTNNAEAATFTGITANANGTYTLTGVKTGLAKSPYTQTSGLVRNHAGGTKVVITDNAEFWYTFPNKNNDENVIGKWTFPGATLTRITFSSDVDTTTVTDPVTYGQLQRTAIAGGTVSSTTVLGYVKISVDPSNPLSPISVGDNDPRVPTQSENDALVGNNTDVAVGTGNKFVTQTGLQHGAEKYVAVSSSSSTTYVLTLAPAPTSYTNGMEVLAKIDVANTTTTPVLNVNGLGNKTIVKGTSTALVANDMVANQVARFVYDGTNMVLQNPSTNVMFKTGNTTHDMSSTTTTTIAHGLGVTPKLVTFHVNASVGSSAMAGQVVSSYGMYDGSTQNSNFLAYSSNGTTYFSGQDTTHAIHYASGATATANSDILAGTVTFDSTNITITWSKTSSPTGTGNIIWTAQA